MTIAIACLTYVIDREVDESTVPAYPLACKKIYSFIKTAIILGRLISVLRGDIIPYIIYSSGLSLRRCNSVM